ncbi:SNAP25 homologous protein SNAP33-like [Punica granatum]|uniref:t-SNARE coiled-coil homology domain-containing protein n=2 Tax=Punica granatum TaxID=22663 RepID=A0A218VXE9_PUNGR|nr:SNAP25 homologous protein SNAP33-like [Punica granatum]OWM65244.1 hypothetical protein CDL15_Pgr008834 [Punica granatum]PKI47762.1 hypothetical protein CRG98_031895 [Punica granatum]
MFGSKKSPLKSSKASSNPFDSDDEFDRKPARNTLPRKTSSEPTLNPPDFGSNPFDDYDGKETPSSYPNSVTSASKNKYKNDFHDSGGLENQSVQELENYAVYKAEETTKTVNGCLKIAEDIREDATQTLVTLHQQGEQITRTHDLAANIDHDLSRGEKLLGSLGGMFSKTWKPKKTRSISGPVITRDEIQRKGHHLEQRDKLGLTSSSRPKSHSRMPPAEPTDALQKIEVEKAKQDDGLNDLSNLLGEMKDMAVDMGTEIERQNKSLDHFYDDADELDFRVKQAAQRGRRLLGK